MKRPVAGRPAAAQDPRPARAVQGPDPGPAAQPPPVQVRDLSVALDCVEVLRSVRLTVAAGEWVTIIGPNGAGKSTLLRAVGGLLPGRGAAGSSASAVRLFGTPVGQLGRRQRARQVAVVPQSPVLPVGIGVFDYVLLGRTPHIPALGRESATDLEAVREVLDALDLSGFAGRRLATLSGGERQRVYLARALAQGAPLLLLDEPTTALDVGHQQEVLDLVDRLRRERGLTVLTTMHDLLVAGQYADRLVLLAGGRVVAEGTPREVLTERLLSRHYQARVVVVDVGHGPLVLPVRDLPAAGAGDTGAGMAK